MKRANDKPSIYTHLLRLYPRAYRERYGKEILQTIEDMLEETSASKDRVIISVRLITDLFITASKQQIMHIGGTMQSTTPHYIKRNGLIASAMLFPFFLAIVANNLDRLIFNQTLYSSWLWHAPVLLLWVFLLPVLALLVAVVSYVVYLFRKSTDMAFMKRVLDVTHSWPVLITGIAAFGILFAIVFHDSTHCWIQTPSHLVSHFSQTLQCSEQNSVSLSTLFEQTFRG